jgi:hypothetical protein
LAELLKAANRVYGGESRNDFAEKKNRLTGYVKRLVLLLNMVRRKRFELPPPWFVADYLDLSKIVNNQFIGQLHLYY